MGSVLQGSSGPPNTFRSAICSVSPSGAAQKPPTRHGYNLKGRCNGYGQAMSGLDIGIFVPQMGFTYQEVLHRAQRCDALGIRSLWLYDHLYGPGISGVPSLEAWTVASALLASTERLADGHRVWGL